MIVFVLFVLISLIALFLGAPWKICIAILLILCAFGLVGFMIEESCRRDAAKSAAIRRMRMY